MATEVGSRLGEAMEVDRRRLKQDETNCQGCFTDIKAIIAGFDGEQFWITYKYERLPMFYHFCGLLGHDLRHCASHFLLTRSGGDVEFQYGDWVKATGGCYRSSPK